MKKEKNQVLEIAEKHYEKLRKANGGYSVRTIRAIAKECGIDKSLINTIDILWGGDLFIIDAIWDPSGSSKLEETFAITNYIMNLKPRLNSYGK